MGRDEGKLLVMASREDEAQMDGSGVVLPMVLVAPRFVQHAVSWAGHGRWRGGERGSASVQQERGQRRARWRSMGSSSIGWRGRSQDVAEGGSNLGAGEQRRPWRARAALGSFGLTCLSHTWELHQGEGLARGESFTERGRDVLRG